MVTRQAFQRLNQIQNQCYCDIYPIWKLWIIQTTPKQMSNFSATHNFSICIPILCFNVILLNSIVFCNSVHFANINSKLAKLTTHESTNLMSVGCFITKTFLDLVFGEIYLPNHSTNCHSSNKSTMLTAKLMISGNKGSQKLETFHKSKERIGTDQFNLHTAKFY